jgi:hypothetical protein
LEYGIQRRTVYLTPPIDDDLEWFFRQFDNEEIWSMYGYTEPSRDRIRTRYEEGNVVLGIARRVRDKKRIGFGLLFPPTPEYDGWEFGNAIPDHNDRDAFSAMAINDVIAHYAFEHLHISHGRYRIRADNRNAEVIVRRMGYRPNMLMDINGHRYKFFRATPEIWQKRRDRIDRGEAAHPSGHGGPFLLLPEPPYEPAPMGESSEE